jgi:hypothetical protein
LILMKLANDFEVGDWRILICGVDRNGSEIVYFSISPLQVAPGSYNISNSDGIEVRTWTGDFVGELPSGGVDVNVIESKGNRLKIDSPLQG